MGNLSILRLHSEALQKLYNIFFLSCSSVPPLSVSISVRIWHLSSCSSLQDLKEYPSLCYHPLTRSVPLWALKTVKKTKKKTCKAITFGVNIHMLILAAPHTVGNINKPSTTNFSTINVKNKLNKFLSSDVRQNIGFWCVEDSYSSKTYHTYLAAAMLAYFI